MVKSLQLQILAERIIAVIKAQPNKMIDISQLYAEYAHMHQFKLQPKDFGCRNLSTLLEQLKYCVKVQLFSIVKIFSLLFQIKWSC